MLEKSVAAIIEGTPGLDKEHSASMNMKLQSKLVGLLSRSRPRALRGARV